MTDNQHVTDKLDKQLESPTKEQETLQEEVSEKSRRHFKYRSNECLNCGQPLDLSDRYCPYCSQLNSKKQLSLVDFFTEFFSSLISYDSRLWFTLKDLLFKPGTITKNYIDGHRLRYANPFRFFLSVSLIYFLLNGLVQFISPSEDGFNTIDTSKGGVVQFDMTADEVAGEEEITPYQNREETLTSNPDSKQEVTAAFSDASQALTIANSKPPNKILETEKNSDASILKTSIKNDTVSNIKDKEGLDPVYLTELKLQKMNWAERNVNRFSTYHDFWENTEIKNAKKALDSLNHPHTRLNVWLYKKNNTAKRIKEDPRNFINYLAGKIPFFLFFFAPFFGVFFWLIYSKKKYNYMEHLVFIFHIFSFIFLSMIIAKIPDVIVGSKFFVSLFFILIGPIYFYKALRNFYKQSRLITSIKFVFLNTIFLFGITVSTIIFLGITAATY